jgi:hypothetical protein
MARAAFDASVSEAGKLTAHKSADASVAAILTFSGEIASNDPGRRASAAFQVLYATIARFLSLGSTAESADGGDWHMLKGELATMCIAYLKH